MVMIVKTDAVIQPRAVVVHLQHAALAHTAVVSTLKDIKKKILYDKCLI